jgi:CBS domain containing-hemolysin-like protein
VAEVADVFGRLGIDDVETERKTLSGFLAERLEKVPAAGSHLDVNGFRFEVTKANNRRAERVRVTKLDAATD